jgi:hypothetical protein
MEKIMGMRRHTDIFEVLGLARLPWITRVYLLLVFMFTLLLLLSGAFAFNAQIGLIASDSLKMALAALLGALTQAEGRTAPEPPETKTPEKGKIVG